MVASRPLIAVKLLINFTNYLSQKLNTRVYIGDPWARVRHPIELKGVLQESAFSFFVSDFGSCSLMIK